MHILGHSHTRTLASPPFLFAPCQPIPETVHGASAVAIDTVARAQALRERPAPPAPLVDNHEGVYVGWWQGARVGAVFRAPIPTNVVGEGIARAVLLAQGLCMPWPACALRKQGSLACTHECVLHTCYPKSAWRIYVCASIFLGAAHCQNPSQRLC